MQSRVDSLIHWQDQLQKFKNTDALLYYREALGRKVQVTRSDGSGVKFKVEAISNEGLAGYGIFVAYSDSFHVRFREHSTAKTVGLVVAILVVIKGLSDYADAVSYPGSGL